MTTTMQPPPVPPLPPQPPASGPSASGPAASGPPPTRSSSRVVAIVLSCIGALVILGAVVSAVFAGVRTGLIETTTRHLAVSDVQDLDVDVSAGSLRIEFADVQEARLEVTGLGGAEQWTFEKYGSDLVVSTPSGWFGWFGGGIFGGGVGDGTLTLPLSLEGLSADLDLSAGDLRAAGAFDELDLQVSAGRADISAQVRDLDAEVSAGRADLEVAQVDEASLSVSAGELNATFTGARPEAVTADVSAGSMRIVVPDGDYDVTSDVSAGGFDNRVRSVPGASSTIDVQVSAGNVTLRAED